MNGYSKIRSMNTSKSRSMDFSDLQFFPQKPNLIEKKSDPLVYTTSKAEEPKQMKTTPSEAEDEDDINGGRFSVILKRNISISSTTTLKSAVKRAFSMRRSSSVSERYCRIYDQCVPLASPFEDGDGDDDGGFEGTTMETRSVVVKKKKHRSAKIFKACKRLIGL